VKAGLPISLLRENLGLRLERRRRRCWSPRPMRLEPQP